MCLCALLVVMIVFAFWLDFDDRALVGFGGSWF